MSRSRRVTPVLGNCADSERAFKACEHRRERSRVRQKLSAGEELPHPKSFGNPWNGPKDGKSYSADLDPNWLRK